MSEKRKIAEATVIIGVFAVLGKILGFVREIIIAAIFGTTYRTDAYFIGMAGPDFIREIISGSVLTAVFIPVYSASLAGKNEEETKKLLNTTATMLLLALAASAILGFPLAPWIVRAVAPEINPQTFVLAVEITRIIFPAMLFLGLASFYGSLLNVHRHFFTPSLNQVMLNTGIIAGVVLLGSKYGIKSLAIGFLLGAMLQFLVILPSLKERSINFKFGLIMTPEVKKMFAIWLPLFVASFVATANELVSRSLAAGIGEGNVAGITFANRIRETIWLLCAVPLGTAVFPYLSDYATKNDVKELEKTISFSLRLTAFLALPMCLIMLFYNVPIVQILFQRGQFNAESSRLTSSALLYYSTGALFFTLNYVILRIYYSVQDVKTPLAVYSAALLVNILLGIALRKYMMVGGIALARSLSDFTAFFLMLIVLVRKYPSMEFGGILKNFIKIFFITLLCAGVSLLAFNLIPVSSKLSVNVLRLLTAFVVFSVLYLGISLVSGNEEMEALKRRVAGKFL